MKAMILAAGRGSRMRHLTDHTPKPLLKVADKTLIEYQIESLQKAGVTEIIINLGYLGEKIESYLGSGYRYGVHLAYSKEPQTGLETGGGVYQALPFFENQPFLLTNADVFTDYNYATLIDQSVRGIHLILVENPSFKDKGDFALQGSNLVTGTAYTFSGISLLHPKIFAEQSAGFYPIAPIFNQQIQMAQATGEIYTGDWHNLGTPEQLAELNNLLKRWA